ncbi:transposase [Roseomonas mucosa]|uniref:IS66-like element accessory protein TnpA n=2 Tax=Roseomonas mucosa TaxID=207340 RepID=UPI0028CE2E44|nr:transposase [Roseomonas mucosa]MDT8277838.1 transposase [Roseomonas mucosa]QDD96872.1 Transposase [Roseomonas mucosa]
MDGRPPLTSGEEAGPFPLERKRGDEAVLPARVLNVVGQPGAGGLRADVMDSVNDDGKGAGYRRIEVLTGPGRRRRWSDDDKARIVAETAEPDAVVTEVARRWQVSPQQVFDWRRQARKALAVGTAPPEPAFVPIVAQAESSSSPEPVAAPARATPAIEIKLAGAVLRIAPGTDGEFLTMVLRAIRVSAA